jgi:hypothetical protein
MGKQITERINDFTESERKKLEEFKKNNRPGLMSATKDPEATVKWFGLYMSGKMYSEIAKIVAVKTEIILFISERQNWCKKREEYYDQINDVVIKKYNQVKLESINTVTSMVAALNTYFGEKFNSFLLNKDPEIIENLDPRLLAQYQKAQENIDKIMGITGGDSSNPKKPLININMTGGSIKQTDDAIEIEAIDDDEKEKAVANILSNLSNLKKMKESKKD